jgi:hypothetical protein
MHCRDDVCDHDKWAAHFGAQRILHGIEVRGNTAGEDSMPSCLLGAHNSCREEGAASQPCPVKPPRLQQGLPADPAG